MNRVRSRLIGFAVSVGAAVLALGVSYVIIAATGGDPDAAAKALWDGAFGSRAQIAGTLSETVPLVLVALGCPYQEQVIARYYEAAPAAVWIGVGGTLDILAGRTRRAPRLLQRLGLEWLARLAQEPRRLWRRYLLRDVPALVAATPACVASGLRTLAGRRAVLQR